MGNGALCKPCWAIHRAKQNAKDPRGVMLTSAKNRSKRDGFPCDINKEDIVIPSHCPILGFKLSTKMGSKGSAENSPSLDKIYPYKGYVRGNIQVISSMANAMKQHASLAQCVLLGDWARKQLGW